MAKLVTPFQKYKCSKPLQSGQKKLILNLFNSRCAEFPSVPIDEIVKDVSSETGVSERSIYNIRKEINESGVLTTPNKKRKRKQLTEKYDAYVKCAVRQKVHSYFFENKLPTIGCE